MRTPGPVEALLAEVASVAFARFTADGVLMEANQGFLQAVEVPDGVVRLIDLVAPGQGDGLESTLANRRNSPLRRDVQFFAGAGTRVSLLVSWVWDGDELLLIGEPPGSDSAAKQALLVRLSQQVSELTQANDRKSKRLERALEELQAAQERVEALSWEDALTGLASRRWLDEVLRLETVRAQRYVQPFCVVMVDVDQLVVINESFGHAAGDQVLKAVASGLTAAVRSTDVVGRYGGDEFLSMLPRCALDQARAVAERMGLNVSAAPLTFRQEPVTASFGIAQWLPGDTAASLVERAGEELHAAKKRGNGHVAG
ncbi:MAG TPA: diguanylate cyclase [Propionicimonas sp.]|jgi:diguanylate cyclase (GGDEF)-like protein